MMAKKPKSSGKPQLWQQSTEIAIFFFDELSRRKLFTTATVTYVVSVASNVPLTGKKSQDRTPKDPDPRIDIYSTVQKSKSLTVSAKIA